MLHITRYSGEDQREEGESHLGAPSEASPLAPAPPCLHPVALERQARASTRLLIPLRPGLIEAVLTRRHEMRYHFDFCPFSPPFETLPIIAEEYDVPSKAFSRDLGSEDEACSRLNSDQKARLKISRRTPARYHGVRVEAHCDTRASRNEACSRRRLNA